MNILLSSYSFGAYRGSEAGVGWNIAKGLAQKGHSVSVITTREFENINLPAIQNENLPIRLIQEDFGLQTFTSSKSYRYWQRKIRKTIHQECSKHEYDLIHHVTFNQYRNIHDVFASSLPYIIGPVGGAELIPAPLLEYGNLPLAVRIKELIRYCSLDAVPLIHRSKRHAAKGKVLTSNTATAHRLLKLPIPPEVCPAIALYKNEIIQQPAQSAQNLSFILFDGGLARPQKGTWLALRSIQRLWKGGIHIPLRVVGIHANDAKKIHDYAQHINLPAEALQLEGHVTRAAMLQYMQQAAVMFSCVYRDSGSMALLEALAQGCRIVCLDIPSQEWLPEQFCHKVAVQPTSAAMEEALASALQQEITAPANTAEWHADRVKWIEENMTWESRIDQFEAWYRQLLA